MSVGTVRQTRKSLRYSRDRGVIFKSFTVSLERGGTVLVEFLGETSEEPDHVEVLLSDRTRDSLEEDIYNAVAGQPDVTDENKGIL